MNIVLAQDKFEFIGGTTTLLVDLASSLLRQGHKLYYWSTDFGRNSITEDWFKSNNIEMYLGQPIDAAITCQQTATYFFLNKCKVLQLLNSKFTSFEYPVKGAIHISVSVEIKNFVKEKFGIDTPVMLNGIDLNRYKPNGELHSKPRVLSICQGNDKLLELACNELGYEFKSVPKDVGGRIWNIEDWIKESDIVVGIGRSAFVGMACGKCVISWDNRSLNPNTGCGYIEPARFFEYVKTNMTGREFPPIDTVDKLKNELLKYKPDDGRLLREIALLHLNADTNARIYVNKLGG
jgi:hypothetical protein